jgi:hypothetical protein
LETLENLYPQKNLCFEKDRPNSILTQIPRIAASIFSTTAGITMTAAARSAWEEPSATVRDKAFLMAKVDGTF